MVVRCCGITEIITFIIPAGPNLDPSKDSIHRAVEFHNLVPKRLKKQSTPFDIRQGGINLILMVPLLEILTSLEQGVSFEIPKGEWVIGFQGYLSVATNTVAEL